MATENVFEIYKSNAYISLFAIPTFVKYRIPTTPDSGYAEAQRYARQFKVDISKCIILYENVLVRFKFHCVFFLMVQWTIRRHWMRYSA